MLGAIRYQRRCDCQITERLAELAKLDHGLVFIGARWTLASTMVHIVQVFERIC